MSISYEGAIESIRNYGFTTNSTKAIQEISKKEFNGNQYRKAIQDAISTEVINPADLDDINAEYMYKYLVQELVSGETDIDVAIATARDKAATMVDRINNGDLKFLLATKDSDEDEEEQKPKKTKKTKMKDQAEQLFFENMHELNRKQMINKFVEELGMSKAGASTYYHNCKKKFEDQ